SGAAGGGAGMRRVREVIVVEGRYDKNTLSQVVDATILETGGFQIFSDQERLSLLRRLGEARGLILLTDSDGAGFLIRNRLKSRLGGIPVKMAYVPDLYGKEKRKASPGKEGKLGVEGMRPEVLLEALRRAGATFEEEDAPPRTGLTKADFYELGLSGGQDSAAKRKALCRRLALPERLTAGALLEVLNLLTTREELATLLRGEDRE
ncbi:MAG: toprim domain-containing protein, partial [bacterium]